MMKKWSAWLVIALFVVSIVPAVFAEGSGETGTETSTETSVESDTSVKTSGHIKDSIREKIQATRDKMMETRAMVKDTHAAFIDARMKIRSGRATSTDKQEFLLAAADEVLELLNSLKTRVEASDIENKDKVLADIDAAIESMTSAKAEVAALNPETATREEIRTAAQDMRNAWKQAHSVLKSGVEHVVHKRVGNVIQRMNHLSTKLDKILAHLTEKGYDVSAAADLKAQFEAKLDSAKTHEEASTTAFNSGDVQTANTEMRAAMSDLKAAHDILVDLVKSIRATAKSDDIASAETQASTETSTETAADSESDAQDNEAPEQEEQEAPEQEEAPENETDQDDADESTSTDVDVDTNVSVDANVTV
ncbi:MAG TPA: hypothetical protein VLJ21_03545 [Candidatus Binatia bacterium]|nr:hypothetical protein [Candidatus Binatia bacterium]